MVRAETDSWPQLRQELDWVTAEEGGAPVLRVTDPRFGRQLRFAGREAVLLGLLRQQLGPAQLDGALAASGQAPAAQTGELTGLVAALGRLHLFADQGPDLELVEAMRRLLVSPLPPRPVRSVALSPAQAASVPLEFDPGVRYGCAGCGVCCHSFLLGPLRPPDVARLERLHWPAGARLPVGEQALHYLEDEGEPVPFLRTYKGGCVYLASDGLCEIHRQAGEAVKPLVCRLFPYTFTRLGPKASARVAVSIQFESRALGRGHADGPPLQQQEAYLRGLLAELGSVPALPESVALNEVRRVPLRIALRVDGAALAALERQPPTVSLAELARQTVTPLLDLLGPAAAREATPRRGGEASAPAATTTPPLPGLDRWLEALLAWQQEIETGLVPLLPETLGAQRELLLALERRAAGGPPARLSAEPVAFLRSWLRAAVHGRDAYRAPDLLGGWLRNLLRLAVTALLAAEDAAGDGEAWGRAAIRASKLFQLGHSPDRPAHWLLASLPPRRRLEAVLGWLAELESPAPLRPVA